MPSKLISTTLLKSTYSNCDINLKSASKVLHEYLSTFGVGVIGSSLDESILKSCIDSKLAQAKLPLSLSNQISVILKKEVECFDYMSKNQKKKKTEVMSSLDIIKGAINAFFETVEMKVYELYKGLVHELFVTLNRVPSTTSMTNFLYRYSIWAILDLLEEKFKFHTGYLVCKLIPPTELPVGNLEENEIPGIVIGGWVRRFFESTKVPIDPILDNHGRVIMPGKLIVAQALQNAKRAACAISEKKQILSILSHQKSLTGGDVNRTEENCEKFIPRVVKKLQKLCKIYYPKKLQQEIPIWRIPSQSSCLEKTRLECGAMGVLRDRYFVADANFHIGEIKAQVAIEKLYESKFDFSLNEVPLFSFGFEPQSIKETLFNNIKGKSYQTAQYHQVLEPFKVRGITAAEAEVQHLGRLIQPVLHKYLRDQNGPFRFIGKSHNLEDIQQVYLGSRIWTEETVATHESSKNPRIFFPTFFVAGDYKSATDNMDPIFPKAFCNIMKLHTDLSEDWLHILDLTLGAHKIIYPALPEGPRFQDLKSLYQPEIMQTWGQLMGSPTSFIVLCLVNAAMFWTSAELYMKRFMQWSEVLDRFRPLFNGDDISFLSNKSHYAIWKDVCTTCGLALSAGKNYITDKFININSTCFNVVYKKERDWDDSKEVIDIWQAFIPNAGLMKGQAKVLEDTRKEKSSVLKTSLMPVCDQLTKCLEAATEEEQLRTCSVFYTELKDRLSKSIRSWCLPRHLGGLGLPFYSEGKIVTNLQLVAAERLCQKYKDVSDEREEADFMSQSRSYWTQIFRSMKNLTDLTEFPTKVLFPEQCDYTETMYDVPTLSQCFISSTRDSEEGKKKKKDRFKKTPEEKFRKYLNKIKKCSLKYKDWDILEYVERFRSTRLSQSGTDVKLIVEIANRAQIPVDPAAEAVEDLLNE